MQDPNDGGVYHKLTTKGFDDFILPEQTDKPRYVVQKSTAAALDFAATLAYGSRIVDTYGNPGTGRGNETSSPECLGMKPGEP